MKNKGKTKRLMWMTTAACAMMFLGMGVCLICGLRAARESIEESCKRDMEVVMEQLEKPYATRLNTSDELTETMERYLFSQGRREIDLAADGRFLSALNGKSVRDVLFVTTDGHYVSVRGRTGWQKMDRENSGRLTAGKTVSGYRSWNGEEAFFVVKPIEPFFVQGEPYDAIALAYTPGSVNGALSFCAYGGQANVCIIKRDGHAVYAADDVWDQDDIFLRYAGAEKASAQADIRAGQAGCRTLEAKKERVYLAYRPIGDTPYMVVCEAACALVQNVMEDYTALIARIAALIGAMLAAAVIRNLSDLTGRYEVFSKEIDVMGSVSLSIFLSMALMGLKLWQLSELALPLVVMLLAQTAMMALFARFVIFNLMGRDYEAAVITAAGCGFGMGATPNAMANMNAIVARYGPAPKAYFIVPLVGSLFIDFINAFIITLFLNMF